MDDVWLREKMRAEWWASLIRDGVSQEVRGLRGASALCYKRRMRDLREWISEKMRRRPRRGPNDSESTGKSGQELPANQPAPLRPSYPDAVPVRAADTAASTEPDAIVAEPAVVPTNVENVPAEPRMVVETQPESLATPPAEQIGVKTPKGFWVLGI